jgi:hypothetical protein
LRFRWPHDETGKLKEFELARAQFFDMQGGWSTSQSGSMNSL